MVARRAGKDARARVCREDAEILREPSARGPKYCCGLLPRHRVNVSDRNLKENFAPVDARDILARVAALPVTQWSYRNEPGVRRIGPVAQDFHAAFGLGSDDKTIATGDETGVALAAIQGLHQLVQEKDARIDALEQTIEELKAAVSALTARR